MRNTPLSERGVALLITLAFIVMITIILVGFAASMRTDRPAASSFLEKSRAAQYAQSGVETVVAALQQYAAITSGTAGSKANWISQPGQLTVSNTNSFVLANVVPLSSGTGPSPAPLPIYQPAELNIVTLRDPTNKLITNDAGASMRVKWIYVRQDGTLDTSGTPSLVNTTNPIMGRYAYWTDDESSRVNYNIAWKRGGTNTDPSGVPTNIDLTALTGTSSSTAITGAMADAIHTAIVGSSGTNYTFFNSPEDARQVTSATTALQANEFEVTHYNHDPNTTFFNQPRIVLTTHPERAGWTYDTSVTPHTWIGGQPYLQILSGTNTSATSEIADPTKNSKADPGNTSNIDANKLNYTIYFLMSYLQRTDWPMVTGSGSIQSKYFYSYPAASQPERLAQLAISIIDYVRCKESALSIVPALRATHLTPGTYPVQAQISTSFVNPPYGGAGFVISGSQPLFNFTVGANQLSYMGVPRSPCITEMASWKGMYSGSTFNCFSFELYLPKNYGIPFVDLSGSTGNSSGLHPYLGGDLRTITAADCAGGSTILNAGSYMTVTYSGSTSTITGTPATIGVNTSPRFALALSNTSVLTGGGGDRLDIAPLNGGSPGGAGVPLPSNSGTTYTLSGTTNITVPAGVRSTETDDPRVDKHYLDWHFPSATSGGPNNTFGAVNFISTLGKSGTTTSPAPEQDTDASGKITDASLYLPAPAGSAQNPSGMVTSVGELGYICTGVETASFSGTAAGSPMIPPGTPWRTLRLQPNRYTDTTVVPDWAFIDLFTAPAAPVPTNAAYVYAPRGTTFGGRVNVNSLAVPFGIQRILPLAAVLQGCGYDSTNAGATLSSSVAQTIAGNIYNRTLASSGNPGKFYPGTGPTGYISPGEICEIKGIADGGEGTEELVREVSNLYTTRGDVFTVYTVGQALKQTPAGTLVLTGEQRLQATVERYVDSSGAVHFAPVYFRNLTP